MSIVLVSSSANWNYSTLQTNIADWLHRSDDSVMLARIPDFIKLGEADLFRQIKMQGIEKSIDLTMTIGSRFVDLPDSCAEIRALFDSTNQPKERVIQYSDENLPVNTELRGYPTYFSIEDGKLKFDCLADLAYMLTLMYTENQALSNTNQTNEILEKYPDAYLYASLLQAAPYIADDKRIGVWQSYYSKIIQDINKKEHVIRKNTLMRTDLPVLRDTFNINRGY